MMKLSMKKNPRTIPTIIGIALLIISLGASIWLVQTGQIFSLRASPDTAPRQVKITNVSDESFSVSWVTDKETSGFLKYGLNGKVDSTTTDDRDQLSGKVGEFQTHHITVKDLEPSTTYAFEIGSGEKVFDNNGQPYQVTTGPTMTAALPANDVAYGTINSADGLPTEGAIIYLSLANGSIQSTLSKSSGSWAIPLNLVRSEDLSSYLTYDHQASVEEIFVQGGGQGTATAVTTTANDNPIPPIKLGQSYDFRTEGRLPTPTAEATPSSKFDVGEIPSPAPAKLAIINPEKEEKVSTKKPEFLGTAPAGVTLKITVESPETQTGSVVVSEDGSWQWTPPKELSVGEHTVTVQYTDTTGKTQTLSRTFFILAPGELPAIVASPSATPTHTPTPTPKPTGSLTPTPTRRLTPTPTVTPGGRVALPSTESGVPSSGFLTPTFLVFIMGASLILLGYILNYRSHKQFNA
jgi:hypothetical protein